MTNRRAIELLENLLAIIVADSTHCRQRRDNALAQSVKDYYDKKIRRALFDFERITRRLHAIKLQRSDAF